MTISKMTRNHRDYDTKVIFTIGHSTLSISSFLELLVQNAIETLVDVRRFPGSAKFPQFNLQSLKTSLTSTGINYHHMESLGGRRKPAVPTLHSEWRNTSFRGYADYTMSDEFQDAIHQLEKIAIQSITAIMCSEAVWWRCHRSIISDVLKDRGWMVFHIVGRKVSEHPYTSTRRQQQLSL